jgi:HD-like signal output (HDOD) protein/ActR/RegA family two-component response regulator
MKPDLPAAQRTGYAKILVADDDAVTRLVLRNILASEPSWEIVEANNGVAAWRLLEEGLQPDACIVDIRMPELDGLGLLSQIRGSANHKRLKVILCTTVHDRGTIQQAAALAVDYYVVKPFKKDLVLGRVRQAIQDRERPAGPPPNQIVKGDAGAFLQRMGTLPSLPSIYYELVEAVGRPDSSISKVCEIILRDQSLTSRLLKLANSAFYASRSEISTIEGAAQLIGLRQIQDLVLATSVIKTFGKLPKQLVDVTSFWEHSIACGIACALLAERRHDPMPERLFIGGLLHDIGRLVMFLNAPEESNEILQRCENQGQLACKVEREVLGFDHALIGAQLISSWKLPKSFAEMVGGHHVPPKSSLISQDVFLVHYADFITTALQFGNSGEKYASPLIIAESSEREILGDEPVEAVVRQMESRCQAVLPIFLERQSTHDAPAAPEWGVAPAQPESALAGANP